MITTFIVNKNEDAVSDEIASVAGSLASIGRVGGGRAG